MSVHSQRSSPRSARSNSQQQKPPTFLPTLNWADILPPPPRHPPPSELSTATNQNDDQDDYSALCYAEDGSCEKCDSQSENEEEEEKLPSQPVASSRSDRPDPPPRNPRMIQRAVQERTSLERGRDKMANTFAPQHVLDQNLPRTRSFESSIAEDLRTGTSQGIQLILPCLDCLIVLFFFIAWPSMSKENFFVLLRCFFWRVG